jgi:hypothetical protein
MAACERCGSDAGTPFSFLYGTSTVDSGEIDPMVLEVLTTDAVVSTGTAVLCATCVRADHRREVLRFAGSTALFVVTGVGLTLVGYGQAGTDLEGAGIALFLVGLFLLLIAIGTIVGLAMTLITGPETAGEELAIKVHRRTLRQRGFDAFWIHEAWSNHVHAARTQTG